MPQHLTIQHVAPKVKPAVDSLETPNVIRNIRLSSTQKGGVRYAPANHTKTFLKPPSLARSAKSTSLLCMVGTRKSAAGSAAWWRSNPAPDPQAFRFWRDNPAGLLSLSPGASIWIYAIWEDTHRLSENTGAGMSPKGVDGMALSIKPYRPGKVIANDAVFMPRDHAIEWEVSTTWRLGLGANGTPP